MSRPTNRRSVKAEYIETVGQPNGRGHERFVMPDSINCSINLMQMVWDVEKFTVTDMATRTPATRSHAKPTSKENPTSYSAAAPSSWPVSQCEPTYSVKPPTEAREATRLGQPPRSQSAGIEHSDKKHLLITC